MFNAEYLDDPFEDYEDNGEPINRGDLMDVHARLADMTRVHQELMDQMRQQQLLLQQQEEAQQVQLQLRQPRREEKLAEPPSFGSDDPEEDAKVTSKVYSIYWRKVEMWMALVEGRVEQIRCAALLAQKLKGKAANAVWLNGGDFLTTQHGMATIKILLDKLYYGDQTAAVSTNVANILDYKRGKSSMRDYCNEFRNRFQVLDQRGEAFPVRTRGHILLSNAGLTEDQQALVMATTGRGLSFIAISDALTLLFPSLSSTTPTDTQSS